MRTLNKARLERKSPHAPPTAGYAAGSGVFSAGGL